jgi:hypothetical protein
VAKTRRPNRENDNLLQKASRKKWFNFLLLCACFGLLLLTRVQINYPTLGDEPYYLLMDHSLVHDHDLNLKNNFSARDYASFFPYGELPVQGNPTIFKDNPSKVYSVHGVGLPVVLAPAYALDGKIGAVVSMTLIATIVIWLTWVWTFQLTKKRGGAYAAAGALFACSFFNHLAGYAYPDMLLALLTLVALIILNRNHKSWRWQAVLGAAFALMMLSHFRSLYIVVPALAVLVYRRYKAGLRPPWLCVGLVALTILYYFLSLHSWFGLWNPTSLFTPDVNFGNSPFNNVPAMLFDSNRGLLVYNPILLLLFVGLPIWYKQHRSSLLISLAVLAPSIGVLMLFSQYTGGGSPVGRYLMDFLPAFMPAVAFAANKLQAHWQKTVVAMLLLITGLISVNAAVHKFQMINPVEYYKRPPLFLEIQNKTGLALDRPLPSYSVARYHPALADPNTLVGKHDAIKVLVLSAGVLAVTGYGYRLSVSKK